MVDKGLTREFIQERDVRIFKMRQGGAAIAEIARRLSLTTGSVSSAIRRQLVKLNQEALLAYPEVLQMELERLDALQFAIWPLTQHRKIKMDDGTEMSFEPDMKAVATVLSIIDRRTKLLGMDQTNINIQTNINESSPIRATLAGAAITGHSEKFDPESESKKLLTLMAQSGVLPADVISSMLGEHKELVEKTIQDADILDDETEDEAPITD